ncbi:unnamed protein product, partial [Symbiodinium sp. CCMP2456]
ASFLAGQSGQARLQKTFQDPSDQTAEEAPAPEVVEDEGPRPMPYPGHVVPDNALLSELVPPPPLLRTPEPPTPSNPSAVTPAHMLPSLTPVPPETASPVPMLVEPSASAGGDESTAAGGDSAPTAGSSSEGLPSSGTVRPADAPADAPMRTKRLRLDAVQTDASGKQLFHQDEDVTLEGEAAEEFLDCGESADGVEYEPEAAPEIPSCLIKPFSESEPACSPAELDEIDRVADQFEFDRLVQLGVMTEVADKLDGHRMLTSKSVRTWRPKVLAGQKVWLRRSRLVAREYAHLDPERSGQRDGSVTWYNDFTSEMKSAVGVELPPESPALFRLPASAGGGYVHVDDMLCGGVTSLLERLEQHLASKFKISSEWLREVGDEVSFLKRRHLLVSPELLVIEPNVKYVDKLLEVTGMSRGNHRSKGTPFPTGVLPTEQDTDKPLDSATATRFRSAVGILMYMSSDLIACQFGIRYLSTYAHAPTEGAWSHFIKSVWLTIWQRDHWHADKVGPVPTDTNVSDVGAEDEPNTQNHTEDALGQNGVAPGDNLEMLEQILEWFMCGFFLVHDFALEYPTTVMLALQICILCVMCWSLCRRGRLEQLRERAGDAQSATQPTVAVHVKVEGSSVTVGSPEPTGNAGSVVADAPSTSSASASSANASTSSAAARADDHDVRNFRAMPKVRAAPDPKARPTADHAVWVTKSRGRSFHRKRSCGTLGNAKALEQITKSE